MFQPQSIRDRSKVVRDDAALVSAQLSARRVEQHEILVDPAALPSPTARALSTEETVGLESQGFKGVFK
jgi:hypothetical protein